MLRKIVLIDDDALIHSLVRAHLAGEPVEVLSARDGTSGLELAERELPDLVLLDVDMPAPDGFEVCRRLREDPITMNLPVIFLTAAGSTAQKVSGLELGAADYITKPFAPDELVARVRAALRTKARFDFLAARRVEKFMSVPIERGGTVSSR